MPTQSLADQLRLLEEEIELIKSRKRWVGCRPEARQYLSELLSRLLSVAKGMEKERDAESDEVELKTIAMNSMHRTEVQLAAELAALRAENERLRSENQGLLAACDSLDQDNQSLSK